MRLPQFTFLRICILSMLLLAAALSAHGQGCSMCRDTTAGSAPQIRAGLRRAIPVLAIPAIALFLGFFVIARRTDLWHRSEQRQTMEDGR
ncbi:MAG TPA: copper resistance protein CopC [Acidobacteriaceae bacterium]